MAYRADVTDKQQDVLEAATFENGIPVHEDSKIRVIVKKNGAAEERVAHADTGSGVDIGKNAGVVMPASDVTSRFESDTQGKA